MTVEELKAEAAKLPVADRLNLADWIAANEDIRHLRQTELVRQIQEGIDQLDRGEYIECRGEVELDALFDGISARGKAFLEKQKR